MVKVKKYGLILSLFLCPLSGIAQRYSTNPELNIFTGGLIGGMNISQIDGDSYKGYDKVGINAGGIVFLPFGTDMGLPLPGTLALSMEILLSQRGSNGGINPSYGVYKQEINMLYGDVPLMLNWYRGPRKSIVGAGFSIGFLGFREELMDRGMGMQLIKSNDFNFADFSFVLSPNIHVWNGFYLNPRFQYSLISVRRNNSIGNKNQFNNTLSLRLMYLFNRK
jgi:hypothetical protein